MCFFYGSMYTTSLKTWVAPIKERCAAQFMAVPPWFLKIIINVSYTYTIPDGGV